MDPKIRYITSMSNGLLVVEYESALFIASKHNNNANALNEYNTSLELNKKFPDCFNKPEYHLDNIILYDNLRGVGPVFRTKAKTFGVMLKSFIIQLIGILNTIHNNNMSLHNFKNCDIGIEYSSKQYINVLGQKIEIYGSTYKLINFKSLTDKPSNHPMIFLYNIFAKPNIDFPDNYKEILEVINKKKYLTKLEVNTDNKLLQFWIYMIFHPDIISLELKKKVKVIKYLTDEDYLTIARLVNQPIDLMEYFIEKDNVI